MRGWLVVLVVALFAGCVENSPVEAELWEKRATSALLKITQSADRVTEAERKGAASVGLYQENTAILHDARVDLATWDAPENRTEADSAIKTALNRAAAWYAAGLICERDGSAACNEVPPKRESTQAAINAAVLSWDRATSP